MISVGFKTDAGMMRNGNEDALFVLPAQQMYIVADGVGGHSYGELASRTTVGYVAQYVAMHPVDRIEDDDALKEYFLACLRGVNDLILSKAGSGDGGPGMATTVVISYMRGNKAYVVNVGDSRAYLVRDGVIRQVTDDHTWVREMVSRGMITEEEGRNHPDRNMITRAVGAEKDIKPDFFVFDVYPGDTLIMCTDGLYGEVDDQRIAELSEGASTMHKLSRQLVEEANANGGSDNISVVCIRIQ